MKKEYQIVEMPSGKFNIYYYINGDQETVEFYSYSDKIPQTEIRFGYVEKVD